jgi:uncharacterized membrane protein
VLLACSVEMVEAATIVLALGMARGWRSSLVGAATAIVTLGAIVALFGPAILLVPINYLRVVVGVLLLVFGLQWLRKAILRASGYKALHDEDKIFKDELSAAKHAGAKKVSFAMVRDLDAYSFALSYKTVLLEGLEVVFIVLTFGAVQGAIGTAMIAATVALVIVLAAAVALRAPLSRVPENTLKFVVGVLATVFGLFWAGEGAGGGWPFADAALLPLLALVVATSVALVAWLKRRIKVRPLRTSGSKAAPTEAAATPPKSLAKTPHPLPRAARGFLIFAYEFVIGDDWASALVIFAATWLSSLAGVTVLAITFVLVLPFGLRRVLAKIS